MWRVGPYFGMARNSPGGEKWGSIADRDHYMVGVRATAPVLRWQRLTVEFAPEIVPLMIITDNPTYRWVTQFQNGAFRRVQVVDGFAPGLPDNLRGQILDRADPQGTHRLSDLGGIVVDEGREPAGVRVREVGQEAEGDQQVRAATWRQPAPGVGRDAAHGRGLPRPLGPAGRRPTRRGLARWTPVPWSAVAVLVPVGLAALFPRFLAPESPFAEDVSRRLQPPSAEHLFGTDELGRDVLSQLLHGARTAFGMGAIAAITTVVLATMIGAMAAYFRGWVDTGLMRTADFFLLLPPIPFLIFLSTLYDVNVVTLGLVFGIVSGVGPTAIVLKSQALAVSVKPFVDAAKVAGGGSRRIVFRHIVPNIVPLSFLYMMFTVTGAIGAEAILSLFGLIDVPMSWGIMINTADTAGYITRGFDFWWLLIPAGLAVTLLAGAFYLVGRALDEVVNPRLRAR